MPSVRDLARDLSINPATVAKGYQHLVDAGILVVKRGEGTFVSEKPPSFPRGEREKELESGAVRYASLAVTLGAANEEAVEQVKRSLGFLRKKSGGTR
jgi:GntR family transcriptional regulator